MRQKALRITHNRLLSLQDDLRDGAPQIQAASLVIASAIQDRIAPYPSPRPGQRYIRGYGFPGRRTSEMLGRRWGIKKEPRGARLYNTASYASYVHSDADQARIHKGRWITDKTAVDSVLSDGTAENILIQAIRKALP